ncbi:lipoprotein [Spiroplasma endosymbiont of Glossina fuscipes fuscipes]|uniref:lipoprotein n=1 Tax=Spiroplasma endosymbiont of Glossina fuscipes fuscipes TaxID=2004463 RepID=UPI003C71436D
MKKLLSILGVIGLTTAITTSLISCEKPNNNENGGNKPEPPYNPQQPPENSSWKLINNSLNNIRKEFEKHNDKWYFIIWKRGNSSNWIWQSMFFKYNESAPRMTGAWLSSIKSIYRWDGLNEPQIPEINTNTGEILDWKE